MGGPAFKPRIEEKTVWVAVALQVGQRIDEQSAPAMKTDTGQMSLELAGVEPGKATMRFAARLMNGKTVIIDFTLKENTDYELVDPDSHLSFGTLRLDKITPGGVSGQLELRVSENSDQFVKPAYFDGNALVVSLEISSIEQPCQLIVCDARGREVHRDGQPRILVPGVYDLRVPFDYYNNPSGAYFIEAYFPDLGRAISEKVMVVK